MWDAWFHSQIVCSKVEHLSNIDEKHFDKYICTWATYLFLSKGMIIMYQNCKFDTNFNLSKNTCSFLKKTGIEILLTFTVTKTSSAPVLARFFIICKKLNQERMACKDSCIVNQSWLRHPKITWGPRLVRFGTWNK